MAGEDEDFGRAVLTVVLDETQAVSDARDLGLRIRRALTRATDDVGEQIRRNIQRGLNAVAVTVRVEPDLSRFDSALLSGLSSLRSINIPVAPDLTGFVERIRALLAGVEIPVRVVPDLDDFDARIRAHRPPDVTVNVNADTNRLTRALSGVASVAGRVGGALAGLLGFGAVGIAAAAAAQGVVAFTAALAPAAGIIAAVPAAIFATQIALGTLRLALVGVGEALKAAVTGSAADFQKSIENLAPAAQAALTTVRGFKTELTELQQAVQQSFFKQFAGDVEGALTNLLPLGAELDNVAVQLGKAASEALKFAASQQAAAPLRSLIQSTTDAASGLQVAVAPLAKGFLDIAAAVAAAFGPQVGAGIGQLGADIGTFLSGFAASGRAVEVVRGALGVFQQLGAIASNVGGIIAGVFQAANNVGGGLLANLETITASFQRFVESAQGQEAIGATFSTVATIAAQLGPILAALVTQIGAIAPALAPIFTALGPALVNLISALGPALAAIAPSLATLGTALANGLTLLGPALAPLGTVIATLVTGLAPLLPLVGSLANTVIQILAPAFTAVLAVLNPVIAALVGALLPILPPITAAFTQLLTAVIPLGVALGAALGQAITALGPLLTVLAQAITQVVTSLIPLVTTIINALLPILPPLVAAFAAVVAAVVPLVPPIAELLAALGPLVAKLVEAVAPIVQFAAVVVQAAVVRVLVPIITAIVSALSRLAGGLRIVVGVVTSFVSAVIGGFRFLYNTLIGNSIIPDLINGIVRFFRQLPGRVLGAIRGLVSSIAGVFRSAASRALSTISAFVGEAVAFLRGLPGKAASALSGAAKALVGAGKDLVRGLISGVKSMAGSLASAAKGVVGSAVSAAKGALGIDSPSKVFRDIGRDTGLGFAIGLIGTKAQVAAAAKRVTEGVIKIGREIGVGFIKGLTGTASQIKSTTTKLANDIAAAFKGVRTNVDDRLITLVQTSNQRLQKLAVQRDAIAKKIADANKFAADTTAAALSAFSVQSLSQGRDEVNTDTLLDGLRRGIRQVQRFNAQVQALAKRGLNKSLLEQILGLGPEKGAQLAQSLTEADKATFARINALQKQLTTASNKLGRTGADALFDSGKAAGKGFLAGIKSEQRAIEKLMLDIAKGMQRAIRRALDIRSPSHVFAQIGAMTGAGLQVGLLGQLGALQNAARAAARGVVTSVSGELARMPGAGPIGGDFGTPGNVIPLTRAQRSRQQAKETSGLADALKGIMGKASGGGRAPGPGQVVNQTINITEVGNARATAHRVITRLALAGNGM